MSVTFLPVNESERMSERMLKAHTAWGGTVGSRANPDWAPLDAVSCELVRRAPDPRYVFARELQQRHGFTAAEARTRVERLRH